MPVQAQEGGTVLGGSTGGSGTDDGDGGGTSHNLAGSHTHGITHSAPPQNSPVRISELRLSGPGGAADEFIELYNSTSAPIDLSGWHLVAGTIASPLSDISFAHKTIAPYGHLLVVNSGGYSLGTYATGDVTYTGDIALTSTLELDNAAGTAVDVVGNLWALAAPPSASDQYSYGRRLENGPGADTGDDGQDFNLVDTSVTQSTVDGTGVGPLVGARLGAPGPQNTQSPVQHNADVTLVPTTTILSDGKYSSKGSRLDPKGRVTLRRTFTNNTPFTVSLVRFRATAFTGGASTASGIADLRAVTSGGGTTGGVTLQPLILEAPSSPTQSAKTFSPSFPGASDGNGGGLNSSWQLLSLPSGGLASGASLTVEFNFGIVTDGNYRVVVDAELVPTLDASIVAASGNTPPTSDTWHGQGVQNTSGQDQEATQSVTSPGSATFFVSVKRPGGQAPQSARLSLPNYADFTAAGGVAHVFVGTTAQEITSDITGSTGWTTPLAPGSETLVRVEVSGPVNAMPSLLVQAQDVDSTTSPTTDTVKATTSVTAPLPPPPPDPSTIPYLQRIEWSTDGVNWQTVSGALSLLKGQSLGLRAVNRNPQTHPWYESLDYVPTWTVQQPGHPAATLHLGELIWVVGQSTGTLSFSATAGQTLQSTITVSPDPDDDDDSGGASP